MNGIKLGQFKRQPIKGLGSASGEIDSRSSVVDGGKASVVLGMLGGYCLVIIGRKRVSSVSAELLCGL
jgi:hypothetical protein